MTKRTIMSRRHLLNAATLAFAAILIVPFAASGDETVEILDGVLVEGAVMSAAEAGGASELRFRLDNASGRTLTLTGAGSPLAESGALVMRMPEDGPTEIDGLTVLDQEVLDLLSSHVWIELRGLEQAVQPGDTVDVELLFDTGAVGAIAHVH